LRTCAKACSSERLTCVGVWLKPPFFASLVRYFAPMWPPLMRFLTPFQYRICAIAFDSCGHHWTLPAVNFLHNCSAVSLALVISSSIASRCCCCFCVSLHPVTACSNACSLSDSLLVVRAFSSSWLYCATILGSLHLSRCAFNGTISGGVSHLNAAAGMSTHMRQWSLGIPLPNARYPDRMVCISCNGKKMPSMGALPLLCVLGASFPCWVVTASCKPMFVAVVRTGSSLTSSFISAIIITVSPLARHCTTCSWRSSSIFFLGHGELPSFESPQTCCWYVVKCPFDLHG